MACLSSSDIQFSVRFSNKDFFCKTKPFYCPLICLNPSVKRYILGPHTWPNCWDACLLTNTSRPREPMQWMWYGTPPACTHPLLQGGGGRRHYGDGGGDWMSCFISSAFFPPLQHTHTRLHVCAYVCAWLYRTCMSSMWPAVASIFTLTNPGSEAGGASWE